MPSIREGLLSDKIKSAAAAVVTFGAAYYARHHYLRRRSGDKAPNPQTSSSFEHQQKPNAATSAPLGSFDSAKDHLFEVSVETRIGSSRAESTTTSPASGAKKSSAESENDAEIE